MKKLLLGITGVSLLLIFVLVSCGESGTADVTSKVELQTLAAPTNVKAQVFGETGVIHVTWEPVANAKAYDVYRKSVAPSNQGGETFFVYVTTVNAGAGGYVGYEDVISTINEFKPDVSYTYKVVAISEWSSYNKATVWNPTSDLALQNSSANSNTVKFVAPTGKNPKDPLSPVGTKLTAPEVTLGVVKVYSNTDVQEKLQVSWDVKPGLSYVVYYSYGSDFLVIDSSFAEELTIANGKLVAGQTKAVSEFPLINGNTNVQLVAQHKNSYYQASDPVAKNYEGAKTVLDPVVLNASIAGGKAVKLTWSDDYPGATYQVYRFTGKTAGYAGSYIFDDWTEITDKINAFNDGGTWTAYDSDLNEENQGYVYMLIATLGDAKTIPTTDSVKTQDNQVQAPSPNVRSLGFDVDAKAYKGVQIYWTGKVGQTFKLYRTAVNLDDANNIIGPKTGTWDTVTWTEVTGISTIPSNGDNDNMDYGVIDTPPVKDGYKYKLVTTQGGLTIEKFENITSSPYTNAVTVNISLSASPTIEANTPADVTAGWSNPKNRGTAYTVGITLTTNKDELKALLGAGDAIEIYRAKTYDNSSSQELTGYQKVTFDQAAFLAQKQVVDTPPEPGYYEYKAVVVSGGNQVRNPAATQITATAYTQVIPSLVVNGTARRFEVNGSVAGEYIQGQKLYYKYFDGTTTPTPAEWSDIAASELSYSRTTSPVPAAADQNRYVTANVSVPAATATTTRYYQLYALNGSGVRVLIADDTF